MNIFLRVTKKEIGFSSVFRISIDCFSDWNNTCNNCQTSTDWTSSKQTLVRIRAYTRYSRNCSASVLLYIYASLEKKLIQSGRLKPEIKWIDTKPEKTQYS